MPEYFYKAFYNKSVMQQTLSVYSYVLQKVGTLTSETVNVEQ